MTLTCHVPTSQLVKLQKGYGPEMSSVGIIQIHQQLPRLCEKNWLRLMHSTKSSLSFNFTDELFLLQAAANALAQEWNRCLTCIMNDASKFISFVKLLYFGWSQGKSMESLSIPSTELSANVAALLGTMCHMTKVLCRGNFTFFILCHQCCSCE